MSVIISFPNGVDWYKANWVFRQLVDDIASRFTDRNILTSLETAQALNHLDFGNMEPKFAEELMSVIREVAVGTVKGTIAGWRPEDREGHQMYLDAMSELVSKIDGETTSTPR